MEMIIELWLPIVLSAVFVFVVSSIIHMALPIHKGDYKGLPNEAKVLETMRSQGIAPGHYVFPYVDCMKDMGSPATLEKFKTGPVGFLTVRPSCMPSIGKSLVQWFILSLAISVVVAYATSLSADKGAAFSAILWPATVVAILGYGCSHLEDSIWKGLSWSISLKFFFDGVVYALVTGATFAWLWPS